MTRDETAAGTVGRLPATVVARCVAIIESLAFWGAVLLPIGYLPALLGGSEVHLVAALVGLNVVCLVVGHRHRPGIASQLLVQLVRTEEVTG